MYVEFNGKVANLTPILILSYNIFLGIGGISHSLIYMFVELFLNVQYTAIGLSVSSVRSQLHN